MTSRSNARIARTVYLIKRAETVVRNGLDGCLRPLDVTPRQYVTLSLLREERDQSSAELARKAGITPQSMSETIATILGKGLIEQLGDSGHRRIRRLRLTENGEILLNRCEEVVEVLETRLLSGLSEGAVENLRHALRAIVGAA